MDIFGVLYNTLLQISDRSRRAGCSICVETERDCAGAKSAGRDRVNVAWKRVVMLKIQQACSFFLENEFAFAARPTLI